MHPPNPEGVKLGGGGGGGRGFALFAGGRRQGEG